MKTLAIVFGFALAAVVGAGITGIVTAPVAVAAYISMVALAATLLALTSRPAPAPVGIVPRRTVRAVAEGIVVRAAAGAGRLAAA